MKEDQQQYRERIVTDPRILAGKPVVKGTLIAVDLVLEELSHRPDISELLAAHPRLTRTDVQACLAYAKAIMTGEEVMWTKKYKYDVFISYARHDDNIDDRVIVFVDLFNEELINRGKHFNIFIDKRGTLVGDTFSQIIEQAIDMSQIFIAIITESYLRSPWCQFEFNKFYTMLDRDKRRKLLPVLWNKNGIETCNNTDIYKNIFESTPPPQAASLNMLDCVKPSPLRKQLPHNPVHQVVKKAISELADRICEVVG